MSYLCRQSKFSTLLVSWSLVITVLRGKVNTSPPNRLASSGETRHIDIIGSCYEQNCFVDYAPLKSWMSHVGNNTLLRELTIPGTHDSSAFDTGFIGQANHIRAQVLNFEQQLNMGIRYFDMRIKQINANTFSLHHGMFYLGFEFERVLDDCVSFLRKFPTETILLKIKVEQGSKKSVSKTLEKTYVGDKKYNAYFWTYTSDSPTLGDVRGKIVIVQNFKVI
jgi:hypothetical protein